MRASSELSEEERMRYCRYEKQDFPEGQFVRTKSGWLHDPPEGEPHLAETTSEPLPPPLRMMTVDDLETLGLSRKGGRLGAKGPVEEGKGAQREP
jgi:hypothetical protein